MTSLNLREFENLLDTFELICTDYFKRYTFRGKLRTHPMYSEPDSTVLKGSELKLFFLLTYLKNYPLQQFHAYNFNLSQAKVSEWIKVLTPILNKSLKAMGLSPATTCSELKSQLDSLDITEANMDATEREVNRSSDYEVQKEFYSGKKKSIHLKITY